MTFYLQRSILQSIGQRLHWRFVYAAVLALQLLNFSAVFAEDTDSLRSPAGNVDQPLTVLDISERSIEGRNVIAVMLSVALDGAMNHQQFLDLSVNEEGDQSVDGAWVLSDTGKLLWFSNTQPDTSYRVTVNAGLTAADGQRLVNSHSVDIQTRSLLPSVSFTSSAMFLTHGAGKGLPVSTLNVDRADIEFFRVREEKIDQFLTEFTDSNSAFYSLRHISNFAQLVYSGHYSFDPPANTLINKTIDVSSIEALQQSGLYLAVMRQSGSYGRPSLIWFSVTDLGLQARIYDRLLQVHVASLTSGAAVADASVSLIGKEGKVITRLVSDETGLASFQLPADDIRLITVVKGSHYSLIEMRKPALDLSEFQTGVRIQNQSEVFVYSARDLYRPGESIDFNALIRDADGRPIRPPVLQVRLLAPDGTEVKRFKWSSRQAGYYHYNWTIPASAKLGGWSMQVSSADSPLTVYPFKVEEFLPERMRLSMQKPPKDSTADAGQAIAKRLVVTADQALELPLNGEYLYGAPAAGNRLGVEAHISQWRNPVDTLSNYAFGNIDETQYTRSLSIDDIDLDEQGNGLVTIASEWQTAGSPLRLKVIGSLYESGGRPVTRAFSALVWPREAMLGIRPGFDNNNPKANSRVRFDIVKANLHGDKLAATGIDVKLIREERRYFWVYSESQGWHYEWNDKEYAEQSLTLDIAAGQSARVEFPVEWGNYRLEVREPGAGLLSSSRFYAGQDWYSRWQSQQSLVKPDQITLTLDKKAYRAGDTVKLRIMPPDAGEALVLVESDQPLWSRQVTLPASGTTIDIPLASDWKQHNIYITVSQIRPADNQQEITPKRSFGLVHLPLDRSSRALQVKFDVPEKVLPAQTFQARLEVQADAAEQLPDKVFLTLAAVDAGALAITDFKTPDPQQAFFGARRYGVEIHDLYNQVIEVSNAERARMKFGGDADLARGGDQAVTDVQIVSLFSGLVVVDDNGYAEVPLQLPDFNGRLRLMAVAFSDSSFGSGERELLVAAPVVSQLAKPRFLATGDDSQLALDIHNLSGLDQQFSIDLGLQGPLLFKSVNGKQSVVDQRQLTLADGEKQTLYYDVSAGDFTGHATIDMKITGAQLETAMQRQWHLQVRPAYPLQTRRQVQVLAKDQQMVLQTEFPEGIIAGSASADLSISAQPDLQLRSHLQNLLQYPYGCLEQTSSRVYPLVLADQQIQQRLNLETVDEADRIKMIQSGIDRLATLQLGNGAYGLWNNRSPEEHWLTAYVADFLVTARDMGVHMPPQLLEKTLQRLRKYLSSRGSMLGERWSDESDHYRFAYKAYAAYVLSRVNQAPLGALRTLFEKNRSDSLTGVPLIHLGIALQSMGDQRRGQLSIDAGLSLPRSERQRYYGDYGSTLRDTALMIHLLSPQASKRPDLRAVVFDLGLELTDTLRTRRWLSTQERNALFLAGLAMQVQDNTRWQAELTFQNLARTAAGTSSYHLNLGASQLTDGVTVASVSDSPLYVTSKLSGYPVSAPAEYSNVLAIERSWFNTDGEVINLSRAQTGDLILVQLVVSAAQPTPDSLLVDLLPAGFELENQNLKHAIQLDELTLSGNTATPLAELMQDTRIVHQEYRDDRYVAALDLSGYGAQHVFYLMRAVTPGHYQVPAPTIEDMYRPELRARGAASPAVTVVNRR